LNTIDWRQLRSITARQIINALVRDGFELHNQRLPPALPSRGRRVTVTFHHPGDTFALGTLRSMVERQARWSTDDLARLKLL
jgi:predicted RNA binding protein YcfA (HicA-like mRNA interferase family)